MVTAVVKPNDIRAAQQKTNKIKIKTMKSEKLRRRNAGSPRPLVPLGRRPNMNLNQLLHNKWPINEIIPLLIDIVAARLVFQIVIDTHPHVRGSARPVQIKHKWWSGAKPTDGMAAENPPRKVVWQ